MTKRVNMSQPQEQTERPQRLSVWYFIIGGAAAGVVWSGIDPDGFRVYVADVLQFVGSALQPVFDNVLSRLRNVSGAG